VHEVDLSTSGQAAITIPDVNSGYFYLTVKHRNSIETVSAQPLTFQGGAKTYDFTTGNDMAYGNNLKNISGHFCIFTGDINNDGLIDANDRNSIATAASIFASGYITNDLNGDGIVDALDLIMVDNNTAQFVSVLKP
jgi:hypothetical protein